MRIYIHLANFAATAKHTHNSSKQFVIVVHKLPSNCYKTCMVWSMLLLLSLLNVQLIELMGISIDWNPIVRIKSLQSKKWIAFPLHRTQQIKIQMRRLISSHKTCFHQSSKNKQKKKRDETSKPTITSHQETIVQNLTF